MFAWWLEIGPGLLSMYMGVATATAERGVSGAAGDTEQPANEHAPARAPAAGAGGDSRIARIGDSAGSSSASGCLAGPTARGAGAADGFLREMEGPLSDTAASPRPSLRTGVDARSGWVEATLLLAMLLLARPGARLRWKRQRSQIHGALGIMRLETHSYARGVIEKAFWAAWTARGTWRWA